MPGKERPQPQLDGIPLNERERLFTQVSDRRLRELMARPDVTIHQVSTGPNAYGDFMFITLSAPMSQGREALTFFGLGHHTYRDRWFTDEWHYYRTTTYGGVLDEQVSLDEAQALMQARRDEIAPNVAQHKQSNSGSFFEMIADLTDDDGAIAEMQDLGPMWWGLVTPDDDQEDDDGR